MPYSDFNFYQTEFCGTVIGAAEDFASAAVKAKCYIDWLTNGALKGAEDIPDEVRLAECAISEMYFELENRRGVHSESNDGYQIVYESPDETEMYRIAVRYLPAFLIYRGIGV